MAQALLLRFCKVGKRQFQRSRLRCIIDRQIQGRLLIHLLQDLVKVDAHLASVVGQIVGSDQGR